MESSICSSKVQPSLRATFIGASALLIWASAALCSVELKQVPTFLVVAIVCAGGFITSSLVNRYSSEYIHPGKIPKQCLAIGFLLLFSTQTGYLAAFKYAPPAQVDLIYYLWPIMVVAALTFSLKQQNAGRSLLGATLGFIGVFILIYSETEMKTIQTDYLLGYALALLSALAWGGYTIYSHCSEQAPMGLMGLCCAPTALLAVVLHVIYEPTYIPSLREWMFAALMGVSILGLSMLLWDHGVKRGHVNLLTVLSYFNPILSIGVLVVCGQATTSGQLWLGASFVGLGALVARPLTVPARKV